MKVSPGLPWYAHARARTPVATAVLIALGTRVVFAQEPAKDDSTLGEVVVTAQKREENLQSVPISLNLLNSASLEQLDIKDFKEYVQYLPTVSMQPSPGSGSGFNLGLHARCRNRWRWSGHHVAAQCRHVPR